MKNKAFVTIVCSCLTAVIVTILCLAAPTGVSAQCEIVWEGSGQTTCSFYIPEIPCIPGPYTESGSMPTEEAGITHAAAEELSITYYGNWIERDHAGQIVECYYIYSGHGNSETFCMDGTYSKISCFAFLGICATLRITTGNWWVGCIPDIDSDGVLNSEDNCVTIPNGPDNGTCVQGDTPGLLCSDNLTCGTLGLCSMGQEDGDGDLVGDVCDNCPDTYNEDQTDSDDDGIGDVCEVSAIPTTSEWGMIIFMTIIVGIGVVTLFRRRIE